MRILFTGQPIRSHLVPALIPLARRTQDLGHEVAVATAGSMAAELAGLPHLVLPNVPDQARLRTDPALARRFGMPDRLAPPGVRGVDPAVWPQIARAYAGPMAGCFAADLLEAAGRWKPDIIVREPAEFGGYLAAERLGIPHATLDINPFAALDLPTVHSVLDRQRAALGLAPMGHPAHPHRYLRACLMPPEWYPPSLRLPSDRHYRPPDAGASGAGASGAASGPAGAGPLVLASLGSLVPTLAGLEDLLARIVAALGSMRCRAIVSLGGARVLVGDPVPPNVHIASWVPQRALLAECDLFVTHAGFSSVRESVEAGVPMVALPVISDGPANAGRVAELGLGLRLDLAELSPTTLARTCERVLADRSYRDRVGALRRQMLALPGPDQLVEDLAELAEVMIRHSSRRVAPGS